MNRRLRTTPAGYYPRLGSLVELANNSMAGHRGLDMKDALDVATDDPDLAGEIALLAELMAAVADARVSLDQAAIDAILRSTPSSSGE